jgi:hypothetical protein
MDCTLNTHRDNGRGDGRAASVVADFTSIQRGSPFVVSISVNCGRDKVLATVGEGSFFLHAGTSSSSSLLM